VLYYPELNYLVTWEVMIALSAVYLITVYLMKKMMDKREEINVGSFPIFYNVIQIVLSLYMTWGLLGDKLFAFPNLFGLNFPYSAKTEYFIFIHYLSKLLDFVDTYLILCKKDYRRLSFLHIYHHSSILIIWGLLLHYNVGNGTASFGSGLNALIHTIMYTHYFVTSFGIRNPFKQLVTMSQMFQFFLCLLHSIAALYYEESPLKDYAWIQLAYQSSMLILFGNFFFQTYCGGGEKDDGKKQLGKKPITSSNKKDTTKAKKEENKNGEENEEKKKEETKRPESPKKRIVIKKVGEKTE